MTPAFLYHRGAIEASLGMRARPPPATSAARFRSIRTSPVLYEPDARRLLAQVTR